MLTSSSKHCASCGRSIGDLPHSCARRAGSIGVALARTALLALGVGAVGLAAGCSGSADPGNPGCVEGTSCEDAGTDAAPIPLPAPDAYIEAGCNCAAPEAGYEGGAPEAGTD